MPVLTLLLHPSACSCRCIGEATGACHTMPSGRSCLHTASEFWMCGHHHQLVRVIAKTNAAVYVSITIQPPLSLTGLQSLGSLQPCGAPHCSDLITAALPCPAPRHATTGFVIRRACPTSTWPSTQPVPGNACSHQTTRPTPRNTDRHCNMRHTAHSASAQVQPPAAAPVAVVAAVRCFGGNDSC